MWKKAERAPKAAVAALVSVSVLVALPGLARSAPTATATKVTIEPRQGYFFGYVQSRSSACEVSAWSKTDVKGSAVDPAQMMMIQKVGSFS